METSPLFYLPIVPSIVGIPSPAKSSQVSRSFFGKSVVPSSFLSGNTCAQLSVMKELAVTRSTVGLILLRS